MRDRFVSLAVASLCVLGCFQSAMAQEQTATTQKQRAPNPAFARIEDDPQLPRVLLIGDSISIGYTLAVRDELKGVANVHRIPTNGGPTTNGLKNLDAWLGQSKWDVIHFNWGLHDLKYVGPDGTALAPPDAATSRVQVPLEQYEENLTKLVERLQKTGAKLIWCATTPVPAGATGRVAGSEAEYNAAALKVMQAHGVAINDLCSFSQTRLSDIQIPANVHFTPAGSKVLATQVAAEIKRALAAKPE